jgi:2,4-dienoyl-CoA reductase-like NADH-dependent reductase (Old Yellow Enzyme family)
LLAKLLSPTTNRRTDKYGRSIENRIRLIVEIADKCRKYVSKSFILGIKINSVEFQDKGFTPEEAKGLCEAQEKAHFDYVELSGGTYESLAFNHQCEYEKARVILLRICGADCQASLEDKDVRHRRVQDCRRHGRGARYC